MAFKVILLWQELRKICLLTPKLNKSVNRINK